MHVRRPTSATAATRNQSIRIDTGKYDYLLILISAGAIGQIDLTPLVYDESSGGTGVRLDGTGGQPDYTIRYSGTDDNLASATEIRCAGLPKPWLGFEEVLGATSTYAIIALGFISIEGAASDFKAPLAQATAKQAHSGFA